MSYTIFLLCCWIHDEKYSMDGFVYPTLSKCDPSKQLKCIEFLDLWL